MPSKSAGKIITKILPHKEKVTIYFGKERLSISNDTFSSFYLYKGKLVSKKEEDEILKIENASKYFKYAISLLSKSIYTEWKIREKLYNKGADKTTVDRLIALLKRNDLICDKAFIEDYLEYANEKNMGKNKILTNLAAKGIFKEELVKLSFSRTSELNKAKKYLNKLDKQYSKYSDLSKREHIKQALVRYGFDLDVANEVSKLAKSSSPKEENVKLKKDLAAAKTRLSKKYKGKELREKIFASLISKGYKINDIIKELEK